MTKINTLDDLYQISNSKQDLMIITTDTTIKPCPIKVLFHDEFWLCPDELSILPILKIWEEDATIIVKLSADDVKNALEK